MFLTKWMNFKIVMNFDPQKINPKYTIKDQKNAYYTIPFIKYSKHAKWLPEDGDEIVRN